MVLQEYVLCFNPRPLCRERHKLSTYLPTNYTFQSTPPMQGATVLRNAIIYNVYVSIHAPYAGSDSVYLFPVPNLWVSIHAPYAGSDKHDRMPSGNPHRFQSTPPMQGATGDRQPVLPHAWVSIHAPYAGSDGNKRKIQNSLYSFNPRPLCRERPYGYGNCDGNTWFQSTPPMQGATACLCMEERSISVSIHAPYAGSDPSAFTFPLDQGVSIHAPYAGSDSIGRSFWSNYRSFNPRPLCRERQREQSVKE